MNLPEIALSVRQPWAWAIIHAGKDIENRSWHAKYSQRRTAPCGKRIAIHSSSGMGKAEYWDAVEFIEGRFGISVPPPHELVRGAIIGTVFLVGGASRHHSQWFTGPWGMVLSEPAPESVPIRAKGELGWFRWKPVDEPPPALAKWMKPKPVELEPELLP